MHTQIRHRINNDKMQNMTPFYSNSLSIISPVGAFGAEASRTFISWYTCAVIHALVVQNTMSARQLRQEATASSASHSVQILMQETVQASTWRQLLHRISLMSSSSRPRLYLSLMIELVALTAKPGQQIDSRHIQGTGQVFSHILPGWKQQHPP